MQCGSFTLRNAPLHTELCTLYTYLYLQLYTPQCDDPLTLSLNYFVKNSPINAQYAYKYRIWGTIQPLESVLLIVLMSLHSTTTLK